MLSFLNSFQRLYCSHVLLYHSSFENIPKEIEQKLHNVRPEVMYRQISWLKRHFDPVSVDALVREGGKGRFAISFDDAYTSVFTEGFPVLDSLKMPFTVYVNGNSLQGKSFWRDKVRFLINMKRVSEFLSFLQVKYPQEKLLTESNFYRMTKDSRLNSKFVETVIDEFFSERKLQLSESSYCLKDPAVIPKHTLLTLGNHTLNHYVLSSLSVEDQEREIAGNQELLAGLGVPLSKVFSIPFGDDCDFNESTLRILNKHGYEGFLYSRNRLNPRRGFSRIVDSVKLPAADRYMVSSSFEGFQKHIFKLSLKHLRDRLRY